MPKILYLDKTGDPIDLPLFNTFFGGITGHGKTVLAKAYVKALNEEDPARYVLIVDSTEDQEYRELGQEVPLCFVDTTEPFVLKELLASVSGVYMDRYIGEIIDEMALCKTLKEGLASMERKLDLAKKAGRDRKNEDWMHPRARMNVLVVATALRKLLDLADRMHVVDRLELKPGINRMNLNLKGVDPNLKLGFQQLIVRSVALKILNEWRNVVLILDEAQKYIPQKWGSVAKQAVADLLAEGRKLGNFVMLASQTMVRIDKEPLYNVRYWVMGLQAHPNEVKRTVEILGDVLETTELKAKDVKSLDDGWFWVLTSKTVRKAYARDIDMPEEVARKVAKHELTPKQAWALRKVKVIKEEEELNLEDVKRIVREELQSARPEVEDKGVERFNEDTAELRKKIESLEKQLAQIPSERALVTRQGILDMNSALNERIDKLTRKVEKLEPHPQGASQPVQALQIEAKELSVEISHSEVPLKLSTDTGLGRIMYVEINDLKGEPSQEAEINDVLTEHGWSMNHSTLAPNLGSLVKKGLLVRTEDKPSKYRPPFKVKIVVPKT